MKRILSRLSRVTCEFYSTDRVGAFGEVSDEDWNDWKWQLRNRAMDLEGLQKYITLNEEEQESVLVCNEIFRMAATPYYMSLIDGEDPYCPIKQQCIPSAEETIFLPEDLEDTVHEDVDSPVPGLTHRYPDRCLLLITDQCSMYCRHCCRRRLTGKMDGIIAREQIEEGIDYIRHTPEIRDVLLSGGDALVVEDEDLEWIISTLRGIDHVDIIRIGSRTPVVLPQRITPELCSMLSNYHPIWLNTHFNHPAEMTPSSFLACTRLVDCGIPVGNQSVLLRGINDSVSIYKTLVHLLVSARVRPYYLYICDLAQGIGHFRTPVRKGVEIIEGLRGHTSGFACPQFVVDAPGGGGKVCVGPQNVVCVGDGATVVRNYEGVVVSFKEPLEYVQGVRKESEERWGYGDLGEKMEGVAGLLLNREREGEEKLFLEPKGLKRRERKSGKEDEEKSEEE